MSSLLSEPWPPDTVEPGVVWRRRFSMSFSFVNFVGKGELANAQYTKGPD